MYFSIQIPVCPAKNYRTKGTASTKMLRTTDLGTLTIFKVLT